ncbi:MAG: NUDIX domain-containing protein, partial [Candidatus Komeilibacteria bacterium]|nr:NUDIX domain-containing protein [Candidatus Komeilibacteria bacterium]
RHPELVSGSDTKMPKQVRHDDIEVLLVQRANEKREHWQLPQGGVDKGESEEQAVFREMNEETGAANLQILGKHPKKYSYGWSAWHQRRGSYRGQRQSIFYLRFDPTNDKIAIDEREIKNYQWIALADVMKIVHPMRRPMTEMAINGYKKYGSKT